MIKLAFLILSTFASAENVSSGHYLRCVLERGEGRAIAYSAWVTVHENVQPIEIVDVHLYSPGEFSNTQKSMQALSVSSKMDGSDIIAYGHGKTLAISTLSLHLKASLKDLGRNQEYACSQF